MHTAPPGPAFPSASTEKIEAEYDKVPFEPGRTVEVSRAEWLRISSRAAADRAARRPPAGRSILGLPVLRPDSRAAAAWSIAITVVDLTYTSFFVAVSLAFDAIAPGASWTWLTIVDCAASESNFSLSVSLASINLCTTSHPTLQCFSFSSRSRPVLNRHFHGVSHRVGR